MRKWIIAVALVAALAGCKSTDTQNAAPVEDRAAAEAAKKTAPARRDWGVLRRPALPERRSRTGILPTCCRKSAACISITISS